MDLFLVYDRCFHHITKIHAHQHMEQLLFFRVLTIPPLRRFPQLTMVPLQTTTTVLNHQPLQRPLQAQPHMRRHPLHTRAVLEYLRQHLLVQRQQILHLHVRHALHRPRDEPQRRARQ